MVKKITAILLIVSFSAVITSCSIKKGENINGDTDIRRTTTEQVTLIRNSFEKALPEFRFENDINPTYIDGLTYKFTVRCTQDECNDYVEKVKKAGFDVNSVEGTNYYSAQTEDYYSVEITYIGDILTVLCKRV